MGLGGGGVEGVGRDEFGGVEVPCEVVDSVGLCDFLLGLLNGPAQVAAFDDRQGFVGGVHLVEEGVDVRVGQARFGVGRAVVVDHW